MIDYLKQYWTTDPNAEVRCKMYAFSIFDISKSSLLTRYCDGHL